MNQFTVLAAAEIVERVASLLNQPVEIVETVLWSGLVTGLGLATLHLVTMLVTRWGDKSVEWKSLMFSVLVHVSSIFGLVTVNPPDQLKARSDDEETAVGTQEFEVQSELAEAEDRRPAKQAGNSPVWQKLIDEASDEELIRTNRAATELVPLEGPARKAGPLTAPDVEIADKTALPDELQVRPELRQTGEQAPVRVEAAVPLKIDDPTAESRPEVRIPSAAPAPRSRIPGFSSETVQRQASGGGGGTDRPAPPMESARLSALPDATPGSAISSIAPSRSGLPESTTRRGGPAPATLPLDDGGNTGTPGAGPGKGGGIGSGTGTGVGAGTGGAGGGGPTFSPFSRRLTKGPRGKENGGTETFHPERTAATPNPIAGDFSAVRDGIRTDLPNDGLAVPRSSGPNFEPSRLGKRTTVPPIYEGRNLARRRETARKYGGTDQSERAVELSLRWLSVHQNPEGYWDADGFDANCPGNDRCVGPAGRVEVDEEGVNRLWAGRNADTGVTALAMLAFLGAGYTHEEGQYADQIDRSISWIVRQQRDDGFLGGGSTKYEQMYCHAMATYALAEALSLQSDLSSDVRLREPLKRAVAYIVDYQNSDGGWRYVKGQSSDMSIFGWQLMALKSAELAGIPTPERTKTLMVQFLKDRSLGKNKGLAGYRLVQGQPLPPTDSMSAEALFCKQILGIARTNPACIEAVEHMLARQPRPSQHNLYYWYYGTLAMYQYGGSPWQQWNESLRDTLINEQRTRGHLAGSWDPKAPWGEYGGRIFSTALSTLCLEVYYRFLPLYQMGGQYEGAPEK